MGDTDQFDQSFWEEIARSSPELVDNPEGAEHLAYRFVSQYLPALLEGKAKVSKDHVWLAYWTYLTPRESKRKPFRLSQQAADQLIGEFQKVLSNLSESA